ncbi:MAG: hypothetical protein GEU74_02840 [Nitriliruptorales bacterium]|nr:hypothetical protein [Nitriliruptorales bacterium]
MTNRELPYKIVGRFGVTGERADDMINFVQDRPGHDLRYSVDSSRIRKLGWSQSFSFEGALGETIQWHRQNEWWWRPLKKRGGSCATG